jgi:putative DNA primase/helicase
VAAMLHGAALAVRVVILPGLAPKGDVSDFLGNGGSVEDINQIARATAKWAPETAQALPAPPSAPDDLSDLSLSTAWADESRDEFLYVEGDQWWRYEGGRWHYSSLEIVQASVQRFLTRASLEKPKLTVTRARIQNVVFLAKSLLGPVPLSEFDAHPEWIPLRNGVFDTRTGELLPHCPDYRLTHQAAYDFDPAAKCPRWQKFLGQVMLTSDRLPHSEWITILQEWFGYCMIADVTAQAAMFWVGEGQNGKGTATRVLEQLIGTEYCTAIPIEQLHDPYYRASLHGKLVGLVNEPDPKALQKNGNFFKALTGGDRMDARRPTEKVFSFVPLCRLVISCNDLPATRDVSRGYFRRIILIEWRYNVPDAERDSSLDETLITELPGIFNWAMKGLMRWGTRGRKFDIPAESQTLLADYRMSEDTLGRFLDEGTAKEEEGFVSCSLLYAAYVKWCKLSGEHADSAASVGRRLNKQGFKPLVKRIGPGTTRGWCGLMLTEQEE